MKLTLGESLLSIVAHLTESFSFFFFIFLPTGVQGKSTRAILTPLNGSNSLSVLERPVLNKSL